MSYDACKELSTIAVRDMTGTNAASYAALVQAGAPAGAILDLIARQCPDNLAETLFEEFTELPLEMVNTIMRGWAMATEAGLAFNIRSVRPERPLEFARRRLTRLSMNWDDNGVMFEISHVPGRHAAWQAEVAAPAVA